MTAVSLVIPATALVFATTSAFAYPPDNDNPNAPKCAPGQINKSINSVWPGFTGKIVKYVQKNEDPDPGDIGEGASAWAEFKQNVCEVKGEIIED